MFFYLGSKLIIFFMPFVIGWIISMIANPLVRFLENKLKILRKHSSFAIIVLVLAAVIGIGYLLVDFAIDEVANLIQQAPELYENFIADSQTAGTKLEGVYARLPMEVKDVLDTLKDSLGSTITRWMNTISQPTVSAAGRFVKYLPTLFVMIIFTLLSAYFFVADREKMLAAMRKRTPGVVQERWRMVTASFKKAFGGYFIAQFKIMAVVYVILLVGLLILKVHFAAMVAFLIAFLDMLPFFGTGTALIPWAVFRFLAGDTKMAIALLVIYAVSQVIHQLIQPKLVGDSVGINPFYALVLMFIGFRFGGVLGMIIAIPIGMILANLYESGMFDDLFAGFKMIVSDIYKFLKD